jgi:methionyl-tRNA synthetase
MREIMALADRANQYIDLRKPWTSAKQPDQAAEVQAVCTQGLNLFRVLMIYLQPVLPEMAARGASFFRARSAVELGAMRGKPLLGDDPFCPTSRWPRAWIPRRWRG